VILRSLFGSCMSCHIAGAIFPLHGRVRETHAKHSGGILNDFLTAIALFNNGMAPAAVKLAPFFGHEDAVMAFSQSCTNHGYHILSLWILE
jgi:hypothetical protein